MKRMGLFFFIILAAVGYVIYAFFLKNPEGSMQHAMPPVSVDTLVIKKAPTTFYSVLPGRTTAYQIAEIRPQVNGIIINRLFEEGSHVEEGAQLYQIDPALYEAELASAKADLFKAQANFNSIDAKVKRYDSLLTKKTVSEQDYEDIKLESEKAKAEIAIAKALVDKAQINLNYTKVYAPIAGQIGRSNVTKGALVIANQATSLTTITRLDPIYVDMTESSDEVLRIRNKLKSNQPLKVNLIVDDEGTLYPETGKLQFSDVKVDQTTDTVSLRALFPNPNGVLLPGQFVRAKIDLGTTDTILVPQSAVIRGPGGSTQVWLLKESNIVELHDVAVSLAHNNQWEITSGLKPGDTILINGFQKIRPGATVKPSDSNAAPVKP